MFCFVTNSISLVSPSLRSPHAKTFLLTSLSLSLSSVSQTLQLRDLKVLSLSAYTSVFMSVRNVMWIASICMYIWTYIWILKTLASLRSLFLHSQSDHAFRLLFVRSELQSEPLFSILKFRCRRSYFTCLFVHNFLLVDVFLDFCQLRKTTRIWIYLVPQNDMHFLTSNL